MTKTSPKRINMLILIVKDAFSCYILPLNEIKDGVTRKDTTTAKLT